MGEPSATAPTVAQRTAAVDHVTAVELADLLLAAIAHRNAAVIVVEPAGRRHAIRCGQGEITQTVASVDSALADAVVARLAILANLVVGRAANQLGRLRVRAARSTGGWTTPPTEVLVATRGTPQGLVGELHRIASAGSEDDDLPVALTLGTTDVDEAGPRVGRYRILEQIGSGGMGIVYRAEHVVLQKPVALKVLRPGLAADPLLAAQFVLEARAACRARHPGIVDVTDFGRLPDGSAFIVMELIEGPTLEKILQGGPLAPRRAVAIARRIAAALRAASVHGVVHRDLKPANIFVLADDRVKIGDFGVACILAPGAPPEGAGQRGTVVGTVAYMSPEQGRGELADVRSDIYSLGCVLHEMLTGGLPLDGPTMAPGGETTPPTRPPMIGASGPVPDAVRDVVMRALSPRPDDRQQTVDELLAGLKRAERALAQVGWRRFLR